MNMQKEIKSVHNDPTVGMFKEVYSKLIPWARVSTLLLLMVMVDRRIYCFHESDPDSLPPPVCFSPPKAPPISAPLVGILRLTMPQSDPLGPIHCEK